jgi:hypothetical protein
LQTVFVAIGINPPNLVCVHQIKFDDRFFYALSSAPKSCRKPAAKRLMVDHRRAGRRAAEARDAVMASIPMRGGRNNNSSLAV